MNNEKNIPIVSVNRKIMLVDVCYLDNNDNKPIVLFLHGYKSFKDWGPFNLLAAEFAKAGFVFVKFNFSYNGTTEETPDLITDTEAFGENNIEKEVVDTRSVIDWIRKSDIIMKANGNTSRIHLLGHSRGAAIALIMGTEDTSVRSVACWGVISNFRKVWEFHYDMEEWKKNGVNYRKDKYSGKELPLYYSLYENYLENAERFDIEKVVMKLDKPLLLIHGIDDKDVLYENSLVLKKLKPDAEMELLPYSGHNFGAYHPYDKKSLPYDMQIATDECIRFFRHKKNPG